MKIRFESYFDPKAHPKTAKILLELLKRTKSRYGAFENTPPHRIIFRKFEMPNMLYAEVCDALSDACSLMHVASDGSDWIVVLDATHLAMSDAEFERLNKIVSPAPSIEDIWNKMVTYLKDRECVAIPYTQLKEICDGYTDTVYAKYGERCPCIRRHVTSTTVYYSYLP